MRPSIECPKWHAYSSPQIAGLTGVSYNMVGSSSIEAGGKDAEAFAGLSVTSIMEESLDGWWRDRTLSGLASPTSRSYRMR
jgi:hypothetical protein